MSDERLDKLMRQNLESVRPAYESRAWDRFSKRLPAVGVWPWLLSYGGWLLSGLMLTGWITTLYTLHTNQQVMAKLSQRLAETTQPAPMVSVASRPESALRQPVDTIYIVKRTLVEHRHVYDSTTPGASVDGVVSTDRLTAKNRQEKGAIMTTATKQAIPTGLPKTNSVLATISPADSLKRAIAEATATIPTDLAPTNLAQTATAQPDLAAQPLAAPPSSASVLASTLVATTEQTRQSRPPFRLSMLQPRLGIETTATLNGLGVGPALELFLIDNLGVSVGLQASQLQAENHHGLRDFNSATGREFIDQYNSYLPAKYDQIKDIAVQTTLISLPVTLKYYVPLRRNWSLLVQTGTSFDLAAYQQVDYESYFKGKGQFHSFEISAEPRFFHNFMFGAGVQYRRPRLSAQLSPYYLYDFRSLPNTPAGSNVGVRASVWLDLFK